MNNKLDIYRLHNSVNNYYYNNSVNKGTGRTLAILYLFLGRVHLNIGESYLYVGVSDIEIDSAKVRFLNILDTEKYVYDAKTDYVRILDTKQLFVFSRLSREFILGGNPMYDEIFIDAHDNRSIPPDLTDKVEKLYIKRI